MTNLHLRQVPSAPGRWAFYLGEAPVYLDGRPTPWFATREEAEAAAGLAGFRVGPWGHCFPVQNEPKGVLMKFLLWLVGVAVALAGCGDPIKQQQICNDLALEKQALCGDECVEDSTACRDACPDSGCAAQCTSAGTDCIERCGDDAEEDINDCNPY